MRYSLKKAQASQAIAIASNRERKRHKRHSESKSDGPVSIRAAHPNTFVLSPFVVSQYFSSG